MNRRIYKFTASVLILLIALSAPINVPAAYTATYVVTKTADTNDGTCNADCSLREAIRAANAAPGEDTITLPAGTYLLTIPGTGENQAATGDLDINSDLTLNGAGADTTTIDGNYLDQVLEVRGTSTVTLNGMTILNGTRGVYNSTGSTLYVNNCNFTRNISPADGGGVYNLGIVTIQHSTFHGNSSNNNGGGISNDGTATLIDVVFTNNHSTGGGYNGGGVYNSGTSDLSDVTFSQNTAEYGGGMVNIGSASLNGVTFTANQSGAIAGFGGGGGMTSYDTGSFSSLTNVTFHANISVSSGGGFNIYEGSAELVNVTINGNHGGLGGGINANETSAVTLKNVIISGNTTADRGPDCAGSLTSLGYNLIKEPADCTLTGDETGNIYGVDALLGPLADNGGPTLTQALHPLSPAIDTVNNGQCPSTDQRGEPRPLDGNNDGLSVCDMGAYERLYIPGYPLGVILSGPGEGAVGQPQTFSAIVEPITTTLPLTYVWEADGQSPITHTSGLTDVVSFTWDIPSVYYITVTASNAAWSVMDSQYIFIPDVPISGLEASNDSPTLILHATHFEARIDAGTNVNYFWDFGDGTYDTGAAASHVYGTTGIYTATVYAINPINRLLDTTSVYIIPPSHWWYFPLIDHLVTLP